MEAQVPSLHVRLNISKELEEDIEGKHLSYCWVAVKELKLRV